MYSVYNKHSCLFPVGSFSKCLKCFLVQIRPKTQHRIYYCDMWLYMQNIQDCIPVSSQTRYSVYRALSSTCVYVTCQKHHKHLTDSLSVLLSRHQHGDEPRRRPCHLHWPLPYHVWWMGERKKPQRLVLVLLQPWWPGELPQVRGFRRHWSQSGRCFLLLCMMIRAFTIRLCFASLMCVCSRCFVVCFSWITRCFSCLCSTTKMDATLVVLCFGVYWETNVLVFMSLFSTHCY